LRPIWPPEAPPWLLSAQAVAHIKGARTPIVKSPFLKDWKKNICSGTGVDERHWFFILFWALCCRS
jgi:hypothetical protein